MMRNRSQSFFPMFLISILYGQGFWGNAFPEPKIEYNPRIYVCYRASNNILVDGKLNDPDWEQSVWTESFVDIEGSLKSNPFLDTKVTEEIEDKMRKLALGTSPALWF